MFEKMIESEPAGTEFKTRRSYFLVSSLVVGILFTTAVVFSLYAADIGLGSESFVISTMLAPVEPPPADPAAEQPKLDSRMSAADNKAPTRVVNMARVDEPTIVPTTTSVVANKHLARPDTGRFSIGKVDSNPSGYSGPARSVSGATSGPPTGGLGNEVRKSEAVREPEPPPPARPPAKPPTQSLGVINGKAISLPKPVISAAAAALRIEGRVNVQVLIDEAGRVISANAVSGHPMLKDSAERAARNARFSPTYLSNVPVKVSGVIVYNFTR